MSLNKTLFKPQAFECPERMSWDAPADVLARWAAQPMAAAPTDASTISIYEMIGADPFIGGGVTAKRISAALRAIGPNDVTVKINSPGGDVFEGLAIYSLFAEHQGKVTVDVMGIAASAASVIAMAADDLRMNLGTFLMIHDAWGVTIGNQHDMAAAAEILAKIDAGMADIYAARSKMAKADVQTLMDAETYMSAQEAVDKGFADSVTNQVSPVPANASKPDQNIAAKRQIDAILASSGLPRSERRRLIKDATGMQDAAEDVTRNADMIAAATQLLKTLSS